MFVQSDIHIYDKIISTELLPWQNESMDVKHILIKCNKC